MKHMEKMQNRLNEFMPIDLQRQYFQDGLSKILGKLNKHKQRLLLRTLIAVEDEPFLSIAKVKKEKIRKGKRFEKQKKLQREA